MKEHTTSSRQNTRLEEISDRPHDHRGTKSRIDIFNSNNISDPNKINFKEITNRYELLEQERQHQSEQIHKNMYLSLIITAGILSIFGGSQNNWVLLSASVISAATFAGLGTWTYIYDRTRNEVKNEKTNIYNQFNHRDYFLFAEKRHQKNEMKSHWKQKLLYTFYIVMTAGSLALSGGIIYYGLL
jgi:hypothetical protein